MKIIGITGGIGSGKSVISKLMEIKGIPVYNSDIEAKRVTDSSSVIKQKLIDKFGASLYKEEHLDREALASIVFNQPESLSYLNSIIHPEVFKDFSRWQKTFSTKKMVAIESAILFESGLNKLTNLNIAVSAPEALRIKRVMQRENSEERNILNRIKNQMPEKERNSLADYIIFNDNRKALIPQIENILSKLNIQ
ncbi:dephospho-CoA kinase [Bacteroidales bacterium OttesenSCG-928-M06]|nr:dephospho-CoA kinase [Bacteroidales bacterium OttesenSCG-928-M06]